MKNAIVAADIWDFQRQAQANPLGITFQRGALPQVRAPLLTLTKTQAAPCNVANFLNPVTVMKGCIPAFASYRGGLIL